MANTSLLCATILYILYTVIITETSGATPISLGYKPNRPPYAGATGGDWVNYAGQRIPLGKPWPSRPEDYPSFSATTSRTTLKNRLPDFSTEGQTYLSTTTDAFVTTTEIVKNEFTSTVNTLDEDTSTDDYGVFNSSSVSDSGDNEEKVATTGTSVSPETEVNQSPKLPLPNRPPYLGPTGGNFIPQIIPTGKPWPARPGGGYNRTTQESSLDDVKQKATTTSPITDENTPNEIEINIPPRLPELNRPPFLGPTGGNFIPQIVPPSKPWPARPPINDSSNVTTSRPSTPNEIEINIPPKLPTPNRSPFLGPTGGNFIPQSVPPGKPWPARPEDYEGYNLTTSRPSTPNETEINEPPKLPSPNRPPFLGPTGGNFIPQLVPPGKPWPARPEDYESYNFTSQKPSLNDETSSVKVDQIPLVEEEITTMPNPSIQDNLEDEKIIFPDNPIFDNKINLETTSGLNAKSDIFSVAFYFGDVIPSTQNKDRMKKPSLSISLDLDALKGFKEVDRTDDKKGDIMKATEQFLSSEKVDNNHINKNNYSVWINLKDFVSSPKKSSVRINLSQMAKNSTRKLTEIKDEDVLNLGERQKAGFKTNPFFSIFFNIEDFKNIGKYSSPSNKRKNQSIKNNANRSLLATFSEDSNISNSRKIFF